MKKSYTSWFAYKYHTNLYLPTPGTVSDRALQAAGIFGRSLLNQAFSSFQEIFYVTEITKLLVTNPGTKTETEYMVSKFQVVPNTKKPIRCIFKLVRNLAVFRILNESQYIFFEDLLALYLTALFFSLPALILVHRA